MFKTCKLLLLSLFLLAGCATEFKPIEGVYVPRNFEEAFEELDQMLSQQQKEALRSGETVVADMVLDFGMQLKEYWGLWQDSHMARFMKRRKIEHPDRMITVIFDGYVYHLKNQAAE